jgi:hypothetical protein
MSKRKLPPGTCTYCGCRTFSANSAEGRAQPMRVSTRDHIEPQVLGLHTATPANIVIACCGCNVIKAHYPAEVFRYFLKHHYGTPKFTGVEFRRFIYALTMAGFVAARAVAINDREAA